MMKANKLMTVDEIKQPIRSNLIPVMLHSYTLASKIIVTVPYFFAYKTVFFSFQNNPKNLDPSYKTDLDLWDCLGRVNPVLQQNCIGLI